VFEWLGQSKEQPVNVLSKSHALAALDHARNTSRILVGAMIGSFFVSKATISAGILTDLKALTTKRTTVIDFFY
jgi:hypothetical protein